MTTTKRDPDPITGHDFRVDKPLTKTRAIRDKCLECQGQSRDRVKNCSITGCALWPYRIGKGICQSEDGETVKRTRQLSPEHRAKLSERMKKAREKKK